MIHDRPGVMIMQALEQTKPTHMCHENTRAHTNSSNFWGFTRRNCTLAMRCAVLEVSGFILTT